MNNYILIGIILIALSGALGTYFIQLGKSELATKNSNKTREKIEEKALESKDRDEKFQKTLEDGMN